MHYVIFGLFSIGLFLGIPLYSGYAQQESAREYYQEGIFYVKQGKYEEAIMALEKAITLDSGYADAYNALGVIYYQQKQYDKAAEQYVSAIEADPKHIKARTNLALTYQKQRQYDKARDQLQQVLEQQPDYAPAQTLMKQIQPKAITVEPSSQKSESVPPEKAKKPTKTPQPSEKPKKEPAPKKANALPAGTFASGTMLFLEGRIDAAIETYATSVSQSPQSAAEGYALLGLAYREKYRVTRDPQWRDQELAAFGQAMNAQPNYAPALLGLAEIYYEQGKLSLAYPLFQNVLEYQPDYPARDQIEAIFLGR
ncbi:peptidase S1 and S6 chymotrypsin/Hap [Candidatus Moduliflexus flocculans]|uniref:Peptidase S1 and S6 chymotrypsin/Hap n=1 Tax=Candidatus Moduliflexus flocculans TaxID=1499966 RepID=A0A0S6VWZ6_9BACT|nr:peptidase S1 and S6 chymotrypsin/Hap [Candidatus Moduliflexus flocculans]